MSYETDVSRAILESYSSRLLGHLDNDVIVVGAGPGRFGLRVAAWPERAEGHHPGEAPGPGWRGLGRCHGHERLLGLRRPAHGADFRRHASVGGEGREAHTLRFQRKRAIGRLPWNGS